MIYVINELVNSKKFTNARSLLSSGLLSPGSTVQGLNFHKSNGWKSFIHGKNDGDLLHCWMSSINEKYG